MTETYPQDYAQALAASSGAADLLLTDDEIGVVLDLARLVAHGSERRFAPLSTFVAGKFVLDRTRAGVPLADALEEAVATARRLLPP